MILLLRMCKVNLFIHKIFMRISHYFGTIAEDGRTAGEVSILLDHMNFQKIKLNFFYKIVLIKTRLAVPLKFRDGTFQPDRFPQIELQTDFLQRIKYFVGAGFLPPILDHGIFYHSVILKFLCP